MSVKHLRIVKRRHGVARTWCGRLLDSTRSTMKVRQTTCRACLRALGFPEEKRPCLPG